MTTIPDPESPVPSWAGTTEQLAQFRAGLVDALHALDNADLSNPFYVGEAVIRSCGNPICRLTWDGEQGDWQVRLTDERDLPPTGTEINYQWRVRSEDGHLVIPRSDPNKYDTPAGVLFPTVGDARAWMDDDLAFTDPGDEEELAYMATWVLCVETLAPVDEEAASWPTTKETIAR